MSEYPIFVPAADGEHLAAVLNVPESPRGLALLLQGLGPPRSHRYQLWTRAARALADRGIASVRLDYPEIGDSTGKLEATLDDPPVDAALAVADAALRATGLTAFAALGNCMGGRIALKIQGRAGDCRGIGVILTGDPVKYLARKGFPKARGGVRHALVRKLRRVRGKAGGGIRWIPEVPKTLATSELLVLYAGPESTGAFLERSLSALASRTTGARTVYRYLPARPTNRFELDLPVQQRVVETLVDWLDVLMPARATERPDAAKGVGAVP
ncbi:MAG TPA: hypothetical protein VH989_03700 [Actinomycetota bacterium]